MYMKMQSASHGPVKSLFSPTPAKPVSHGSGRFNPEQRQSFTGSGISELDTDLSFNEHVLSLSSESVKGTPKHHVGNRIEALSASTSGNLSLHISKVEESSSRSFIDTLTSPLPGYSVSQLLSDVSNYGAVHLVDIESDVDSLYAMDSEPGVKRNSLGNRPLLSGHDSTIQKSVSPNATSASMDAYISASVGTSSVPALSRTCSRDYSYSSDSFESMEPTTTVTTSHDSGSQIRGPESPTPSISRQEIHDFPSTISRDSYSPSYDIYDAADEDGTYSDTFETSDVPSTVTDHDQLDQSQVMKDRELVATQLLRVLKRQRDKREDSEEAKPNYTRKSMNHDEQRKAATPANQQQMAEFCEKALKILKQREKQGGPDMPDRMRPVAASKLTLKKDVPISAYGLSSSVMSRLKMECFMSAMAKVAETEIHDPGTCTECYEVNRFLDEEKAKKQFASSVLHHVHNRETEDRLCQHLANTAPVVLLGKLLEDLPRLSDDPREIMHRLNQPFYEYAAEKGRWPRDLPHIDPS